MIFFSETNVWCYFEEERGMIVDWPVWTSPAIPLPPQTYPLATFPLNSEPNQTFFFHNYLNWYSTVTPPPNKFSCIRSIKPIRADVFHTKISNKFLTFLTPLFEQIEKSCQKQSCRELLKKIFVQCVFCVVNEGNTIDFKTLSCRSTPFPPRK